ncbi:MAG TPA: PHP domain-containing protein, partial [Burkholderiaceae bacterium]|nr:PHP domain-containing protein [Burkholderiaceae bacterium]
MFVHLRQHTEFSVVDGTNRIPDTIAAAVQHGQPALAISDLSNLFGTVKFYKTARKKGIKPLIGVEIFLEGFGQDASSVSRILLLVQSTLGFHNVSELLTRAWTQNIIKSQAVCKLAWLQELGDGLIVLSGAQAGPIGQCLLQGDTQRAADIALQLASLFPHRFY